MPENTKEQSSGSSPAPCDDVASQCASGCGKCETARLMSRCMNCRREVENSLSRIGGRQLRKLRALSECSAAKCVAFLRGIEEDALRLHLASMAWWRFSAAGDGSAEPMRQIMAACSSRGPGSGKEYMHRAIRALSPLSQNQLSAWFGCETLYNVASLFSDSLPDIIGSNCGKCRLYKLGCTYYDKIGSDACPLWYDEFVQATAAAVKKAGGWYDPCKGMKEEA